MKLCLKCGREGIFSKDKTRPDGLAKWCKSCVSEYLTKYRADNKERIVQLNARYSKVHAEAHRQKTAKWCKDNPESRTAHLRANYERHKAEGKLDEYYGNTDRERNKLRSRLWRQNNQGRVNATLAKRRADLLKATPKWAEYDKIVELYDKARMLTESTYIDYEVDHIIPLNSPIVCGLHCLDNLQILTGEENNRKKCKVGV
jgi:hypothetical protein